MSQPHAAFKNAGILFINLYCIQLRIKQDKTGITGQPEIALVIMKTGIEQVGRQRGHIYTTVTLETACGNVSHQQT